MTAVNNIIIRCSFADSVGRRVAVILSGGAAQSKEKRAHPGFRVGTDVHAETRVDAMIAGWLEADS
jgi:hypothetical protein